MPLTRPGPALRPRQPAPPPRSQPFRFTLRSLFLLLAVVGVICAIVRSLLSNDFGIVVGIGTFCYGGIIALPCYAFVGSLMVLTTTTTRGQRAGEIFAAAVGAAAWIAFIIAMLSSFPQLCVAFSLVVIALIAWLVRINWKVAEGPSPENSLRRLLAAKQSCKSRPPNQASPPA